jgi:hypothetical protein
MKRKSPKEMASKMYADGGTVGSPWLSLAGAIPTMADGLMSVLDGNPNAYSKEPIINASAARSMVSPYTTKQFASGGISGLGEEEIKQLQELADQQGISIDELISQIQNAGQDNNNTEDTSSQEQETSEEDSQEGDEEEQVFGYGGVASRKINVEGNEVIQTPNGQVGQVKGPKHESGGVNMVVPDGTRIYSDRVKIDDKTMQERKTRRERQMVKLQKALAANPTDRMLKNSLDRTKEVHGREEQEDMAIQTAISKLSRPEKFAAGGIAGDDPLPGESYAQWMLRIMGKTPQKGIISPYAPGSEPNNNMIPIGTNATVNPIASPTRTNVANTGISTTPKVVEPVKAGSNLTAGDIVGLSGNLFNAVAPIFNTNNNAAGNKPNVNRFLGYGHNALETNDFTQDYVGAEHANADTNIDITANTARLRNRNSATSVNTVRALDAITDMGVNKAKVASNDNFSKQMMAILGQRSQLETNIDSTVMRGEAQRDIEDKADRDNYYSNTGANLVNFGTNVQGIGRSLNVHHSNQVDANLLSQLSKYGLGFDDEGNLITVGRK